MTKWNWSDQSVTWSGRPLCLKYKKQVEIYISHLKFCCLIFTKLIWVVLNLRNLNFEVCKLDKKTSQMFKVKSQTHKFRLTAVKCVTERAGKHPLNAASQGQVCRGLWEEAEPETGHAYGVWFRCHCSASDSAAERAATFYFLLSVVALNGTSGPTGDARLSRMKNCKAFRQKCAFLRFPPVVSWRACWSWWSRSLISSDFELNCCEVLHS